MISGDDITRHIASRHSCELADRLFPLSMDGCDATAAALCPVTRCVWWSRGEGAHNSVVCIDQIPASGVNFFAIAFPYHISTFSFFKKDDYPHHLCGKELLRKMTFYLKFTSVSIKKCIR